MAIDFVVPRRIYPSRESFVAKASIQESDICNISSLVGTVLSLQDFIHTVHQELFHSVHIIYKELISDMQFLLLLKFLYHFFLYIKIYIYIIYIICHFPTLPYLDFLKICHINLPSVLCIHFRICFSAL